MPQPPKNFQLTLQKKEQVSKDAYSFYFSRPEDFVFLPGQYCRFILQVQNPDERGTTRLFSLSDSPLAKDHLRITTRIIQSTFKKTLFGLAQGSTLKCFGPMGQFIFDENDTRSRVFLAGGIGITPFLSMIFYAAEKNLTVPITLFASYSTVEETIYYDALSKLSQEHKNIKIVYTVTHPEESQKSWSGETGRITAEMIKKYVPDFSKRLYFLAGPPAMVDSMEEMAKGMGLGVEQIKKEQFVGY